MFAKVSNKIIARIETYSDSVTHFLKPKIMDEENIAFVGCSPRSGSTMLIRILDSHSRIAAPCEIAFPSYFRGDWKRQATNKKYKQICNYYDSNFYRCKGNPQYLIDKIRQKENKEALIIKEPRQSLFFEKIYQDFTQAKLIHLVRDARSIAMSPWFVNNPARGLDIWYRYNNAVLKVLETLDAGRAITVRYEDLVESTAGTVKKVVDFLGYDFEVEMLDYGNFEHADDKMSLWQGTTAQKADQHKALGTKVNQRVLKDRSEYSQAVVKAYNRLHHVAELNARYGYH